ncbi:hypothetical protein F4802DRAFT_457884 [Xylaria palmicola]|nr:hypothetical protein F4802DRAFT_457884 [Xylaria palmicola]
MSLVEQPTPLQGLQGQAGELQEAVVPTVPAESGSADVATEQSRSDSNDPLQVLVDADDEQCLVGEATVLDTRELKTKEVVIEPPAIPKRNTLRTSRLLDSLRLTSIESAAKSLNTTHTLYLSSEEDASSSADEYSDDEYESSSEESSQSPTRRMSEEVTARAVSVIFVGKPCVVELASGRRSVSPVKRPQSEFFGRAASSSFGSDLPPSRPEHSSRKTSLGSVSSLPKESPSFLSQDPFSSSPYTRRETMLAMSTTTSSETYPRAPRTPTGTFQRIQKTISLVRKRSRPNLKAAAENSASMSSLNLSTLNTSQVSQESHEPSTPGVTSPATTQSPVTYNEILRVARRNSIAAPAITLAVSIAQSSMAQSQPASPITPVTGRRSILSSFNMNRRRSTRIRS